MNPVSRLVNVENAAVSANDGKKMAAMMEDDAVKLGTAKRTRGTIANNKFRVPDLRALSTKLHIMRNMRIALQQQQNNCETNTKNGEGGRTARFETQSKRKW